MGRMYTVSFAAAAQTAAQDLIELTAATDKPIKLWGWHVWQTSDLGDAAEEVLALTVSRGVTAGSGGSSVTPAAVNANDTAASFTANRNVTTPHTGGTVIARRGWNIRQPDDFWFLPENAPVCGADDDPVTVDLQVPADSITIGATFWVEELA